MPPGDANDDDLEVASIRDMSAGQFSYPHPSDVTTTPPNAGAEIFDTELDLIGKRISRRGYSLIANDLGSTKFDGLLGFNPSGGTRLLIGETGGTIYKWTGSGSWTSVQAGLTIPTNWTEFVSGSTKIFRLGYTDTIRSSTDGTTWGSEGSGNTNFPQVRFAIYTSTQRMLACNDTANPNGLYYSNSGDPSTWDRTTNLFLFGPKTTTGITGVIEFTSTQIVVFTKDEMFTLDISNATPSNWVRAKVADIGCEAPRSVRLIGEDALFLTRDGVRSILQSAQDRKRGASLPISYPIHDYIQRINWTHADKIIATVWQDKYILNVPMDTATRNTHAFVWSRRAFEANQGKGGWTVWRNFNMNAYATEDFGTGVSLYSGESQADSKAYLVRSVVMANESATDNGTTIQYSETGKRLDFTVPAIDKTFQTIEVEAVAQETGTLLVEAQIDGNGFNTVGTITLNAGVPMLPIALPFNLSGSNKVHGTFDLSVLGRGREVQVRLSSSFFVEVLGYDIFAFQENYQLDTQ